MGIFIYSGDGTAPFPSMGRPISAGEIKGTHWHEECSLLIMPGGRDRPYHAALRGEGCCRIRRFVEEGGVYLGICAGAYFGARQIKFDQGFPLEVCEKRELAFFSGTAVGPAYGRGTFDYSSAKGARAAKLKTPLGEFHAYYNGGCTFEGDFSLCKILARYADLPNSPPAIIECSVGKGRAILSGVHIETRADSLPPFDPFLSEIIPLLAASEAKRQEFIQELLECALR